MNNSFFTSVSNRQFKISPSKFALVSIPLKLQAATLFKKPGPRSEIGAPHRKPNISTFEENYRDPHIQAKPENQIEYFSIVFVYLFSFIMILLKQSELGTLQIKFSNFFLGKERLRGARSPIGAPGKIFLPPEKRSSLHVFFSDPFMAREKHLEEQGPVEFERRPVSFHFFEMRRDPSPPIPLGLGESLVSSDSKRKSSLSRKLSAIWVGSAIKKDNRRSEKAFRLIQINHLFYKSPKKKVFFYKQSISRFSSLREKTK